MRHATLPAQLKGWLNYQVLPTGGNVDKQYYVVGCKVMAQEEVDLPTYFYDERGHNTKVVNSQIVDILPIPGESPGLNGTYQSYINSSGPVIDTPIIYGNGISQREAVYGSASEGNLYVYRAMVRHGIASHQYTIQVSKFHAKFDTFKSGRYTVSYYRGNASETYVFECASNFDARTVDPTPWLAIAEGLSVGNFSFINSWAFSASCSYKLPDMPKLWFEFQEPKWLVDGIGEAPPWVVEGQAQAFKQAVDQFPKYSDNNVANIMEMLEFVKDAIKGEALESMLKSLTGSKKQRLLNLWMLWRYAYSTTSADVKQAIDACSRKQITYLRPLRFDGNAEMPLLLHDGVAKFHVSFEVKQQTSDMLRSIRHGLYNAGIEVSAYTLWDLIPFSFVVDWFLGVGDLLETKVIGDHYSDYIFSNVEWSITYSIMDDSTKLKCYSRWYDNSIPPVPKLDLSKGPSDKTWFKRAVDSVALVYHD